MKIEINIWQKNYIYLLQLSHFIPPFSLHLHPQTKASRMFPPVDNTEINPKRESVEQKGASVWTVVIVGLVISWLWGHNTVVHTVVVDSHTSFPALLSVSMEKLLCCSRCGQDASPLPRLLYVPQNRGKSRIKALLSPRLRPYWGGVAGCFHRDVSCNLGFGLHHHPPSHRRNTIQRCSLGLRRTSISVKQILAGFLTVPLFL